MMKRLCKILAGVTVLAILMNLTLAAMAEEPQAVLDETKTASLTIYKYDMTKAAEDNVSPEGTIAATGEAQSAVESLYADYAIRGVEFTCYKLGDLMTYYAQDEGTTTTSLLYSVSSQAQTALGLTDAEAEAEVDNKLYFTSDCLTTALNAMMSTDTKTIAGKNKLETLVSSGSDGIEMPATNQYGKTTLSGMEQGLYLVVETKVPEEISRTTKPFLLSLPMANTASTGWIYDVTCYPKNYSDQPELKKELAEVTAGTAGTYSDTATASTGDILSYQITSFLPEITSSATYLTEYSFEDVLPAGLTYCENSKTSDDADLVTITWYDKDGSKVTTWSEDDAEAMFTVTIGESDAETPSMTIEMTEEGLAEINGDDETSQQAGLTGYSEYSMVIGYRASLNSDETMVFGDSGNEDRVELTWSRTETAYEDSLSDSCRTYSYGLDITKLFSVQADGADLTDVGFTIHNVTDNEDLYAVNDEDGIYYLTAREAGEDATVFHPDEDGKLMIYGLEDDTYEITEIVTSAGYNLLTDVIEVVITSTSARKTADTGNDLHHDEDTGAGHYQHTGSATVNSEAVTMESSGSSANALVPMTVINSRGYDIPQTGESGTFLIPLLGLIGVGGLLAVTGKMRREEN